MTSAADVAASDNDSNEDSELLKVKRRRDRKDLVNANAAECQENKVWEIVDAFPKRLKKWNLDVADEWHSKTLIAVGVVKAEKVVVLRAHIRFGCACFGSLNSN